MIVEAFLQQCFTRAECFSQCVFHPNLGASELVVVECLGWPSQVLGSILAICARFTGSSFRGAPTAWRHQLPVSDLIAPVHHAGSPEEVPVWVRGFTHEKGGLV